MRAYRCRTFSAATNKPPILPYRGVARAGVCFALEVTLDAVARQAGLEPHEVRLRNLVPAAADAVRQHHQASISTAATIRNACAASSRRSTCQRCAARQAESERAAAHRLRLAASSASRRRTAPSVYAGWGIPMVPGFEQAVARLTPDGGLELRVGVQSHGQGLETTLAQVAHEVLGIPLERSAWCMATPR